MSSKFQLERHHYPVLERYAYLDTSTTGAIPQYVCNAICTYLQERTDFGMDIDYYHEQWEFADRVREEIGADDRSGKRKDHCFWTEFIKSV